MFLYAWCFLMPTHLLFCTAYLIGFFCCILRLSPEAREAAQIVHKNLVHPRRSLIPQLSGTNLGLLLPMLISLALFIAYTYYRAQQQQHSVPQNDELSAESEWS